MGAIEGPPRAYMLPGNSVLLDWQKRAVPIALGAAFVCLIGAILDRDQFMRSWLIAFLFWLGPALGSMGLLMLQYVTGGGWGIALRRIFEAGVRTIPFTALLFVPLIFGMHDLYEWTHADVVAADPLLQHKSIYLNVPFFLGRAAFYFACWAIVGGLLVRWSLEQDGQPSESVARRLHYLSRGGLLIYALTMTFAAIDWSMSLDPHWFSHIYGVVFIGGQMLTAMLIAIVVASRVIERDAVGRYITADRFHDFGKLLLAFIMLWAYFGLSQFLIIWAGNLPEETPWYLARASGGWRTLGIGLFLLHFVVPFAVLLSRPVKRNARALGAIAMALLAVRYVDLYWLVGPSLHRDGFSFHILDVACFAAIGGIWTSIFITRLGSVPLLPMNDPYVDEEDD